MPILIGLPLVVIVLLGVIFLPRVLDSSGPSVPTIEARVNGGGENDSIAIPRSGQPQVRVFVRYSCAQSCEGGTLTIQARGAGVGDPAGVSFSRIDPGQVTVIAVDGGRAAAYPVTQGAAHDGGASLTFPCTAGETISVASSIQSDRGSAQASAKAVCS